jgi:gliding motility-associated-like protein
VKVNEPSVLSLSVANKINVDCKGNSSGVIAVSGSGGVSPYLFNISGGAYGAASIFNSLKAGNYLVGIKDDNGCTSTLTVSITEPAQDLSLSTVGVIPVDCKGNSTGSITVKGIGGTTPYTFNISGGTYSSSSTFNSLKAGIYPIGIIDANGCSSSMNITITEPSASLSLTVAKLQNVDCNGNKSGSVSVTGNGGTSPYTYNIGGGTFSAINVFDSLASGTYIIGVKDNNNCQSSLNVTITEPTVLAFTTSVNNALCYRGNDGSVTISATGGTPTYLYKLGAKSWQSSNTIATLSKGTYTVYIKDNLGCTQSGNITVDEDVIISPVLDVTSTSKQCLGSTFVFTGIKTTINKGTFDVSWDFGDGNTATGTTASNKYKTAGTFTVTMTVTGSTGCKEVLNTQVVVYPNPVVVYCTVDNLNNCQTKQCFKGNEFNFVSTSYVSSGSIVNYEWDFGNGKSASGSTLKSTKHNYTTKGILKTSLLLTSDNGCKAVEYYNVEVLDHPVSKFRVAASDSCFNSNYFDFTSNGTAAVSGSSIKTHQWDFGNNSLPSFSSASMPKNITYTVAGTKNVVLIVEDLNGCKDTASSTVIVHPNPVASFSLDKSTPNSQQCLKNNKFSFVNKSTIASGTMSYFWEFGDGTSSTSQTPASKTYLTEGTYTVKLTIKSNNNCESSTTMNLIVHPMPKPDFKTSLICSLSNTIKFSNNSTISTGTINNYLWDFGDGTTDKSVSSTHVFPSSKTYSVALTVESDKGCIEVVSKSVVVYDKILAQFSVPRSTCGVNAAINFTNLSLTPIGGTKYSWDFGDSSTSSQQNPQHIYGKAGTFTVKLQITTLDGCTDEAKETVKINEIPAASFNLVSNLICSNNKQAEFTNSSKIGSGTLSYEWDFGDGTYSSQINPKHTYGSYGSFLVKLKAISDAGCEHTYSNTIEVRPQPLPGFKLSSGNQCLSNNSVTLEDTTKLFSGSYSYTWQLSDGHIAKNTSPFKYSFKTVGSFNIKLIVVTQFGCSDSMSKSIDIYDDPIANFIINDSSQCIRNNYFQFTDSSIVNTAGGISSYFWDFGDGTNDTSNLSKVTKSYTKYGRMNVQLVIKSLVGCIDKKTIPIDVYDMPKANFAPNQDSQCYNVHTFAYTNSSSISSGNGKLTYDWDLDDGLTSTIMSPSNIIYGSVGTKNIRLNVTSSFGCVDDITKQIVVHPSPSRPVISVHSPIKCYGLDGVLVATTIGGTNPYQYSWNGGSFGIGNDTFKRARAGSYFVIVQDFNGCYNNDTFIFKEPAKLEISHIIHKEVDCFNGRDGDAEILPSGGTAPYTYQWTWLGTGRPSQILAGKRRNDLISGDWEIKLSDFNGCYTLDTIFIKQPQNMVVSILESEPIKCYGETATYSVFASGGTSPYKYYWEQEATASPNVRAGLKASPPNHTVDVVDDKGCRRRFNIVINQPAKLVAKLDSAKPVNCFGENTGALVGNSSGGTGAKRYLWLDNKGVVKSIQQSYQGVSADVYKMLVFDNNNCKDSFENIAIIQPNPIRITVLDNKMPTCYKGKDAFVRVTAYGGNGKFKFKWGTVPSVSDSVIRNIGSGSYKVFATDTLGCMGDSIINVIEKAKNPLLVSSDTVGVCRLDRLNLIASMTNSVQVRWYSDSLKKTWIINPLVMDSLNWGSGGLYKALGIDQNGCVDSTSVYVQIKPKPILTGKVDPVVACLGSNVRLEAKGAVLYQWYKYNKVFVKWDTLGNGSPFMLNSIGRAESGLYWFKGTSMNGCSEMKSLQVRVALDSAGSDKDTQLCAGSIVSIGAKGGTSYSWLTPKAIAVSGPRLLFNRLQETDSGNYVVTIKDQYGCTGVYNTKIHVKPRPKISLSGTSPASVCENSDIYLVANTDAASIDWSGPNGYSFKNSTNLMHLIKNADKNNQGYYKAVAYSTEGCKDSSEHLVIIDPNPNAEFNYSKRCADLLTDDIVGFYSNAGSLGRKYQWFLNNAPISDSMNFTKLFDKAGNYRLKLRVTSAAGCQSETEQQIVVDDAPELIVPTAFTPNNDYLNTWFKPVATRTVKRYVLSIYDRWGNKIFEWEGDNDLNDPKVGSWDGKVNGNMQPVGVYVVIVKYTTICDVDPLNYENEIKGTFMLLR